uniref:Uncharacterized protein n=1 Tax=Glossina brevipalpis TaxID=37001 RepID=A0A1A9WJV3_9MUSC
MPASMRRRHCLLPQLPLHCMQGLPNNILISLLKDTFTLSNINIAMQDSLSTFAALTLQIMCDLGCLRLHSILYINLPFQAILFNYYYLVDEKCFDMNPSSSATNM